MIDRETAMELASDAGFGHMLPADPGLPQTWVGADADKLQRFAAAVAQKAAEAERGACEQVVDAIEKSICFFTNTTYLIECAEAIRARGTAGL